MKKLFTGVLLILILAILAGCGGISIPTEDGGKMRITKDGFAVEGADGSKSQISTDDKGGMVFKSDDGSELQIGEDLDLPDGYPKKTLPLYKEDSILSTSSSEGSYYVMFRSKASIKDSTEYYQDLVESSEGKTVTTSDTGAMIFANIDGRECAILINEDSENKKKSNISLTIGPEK